MRWQSPKTFPILHDQEVHVWRVSVAEAKTKLLELKTLLNKEEEERANRFLVKPAAVSFVVARGILRKLLSRYLQISPVDITFKQNNYGKLYLDSSVLQFNISHSHDLVLLAFALNTAVGIDVEFIRDYCDFADIARKFFSKKDTEQLFSLPKNNQLVAFFNCWTRKEAFIKAKGTGMFTALDGFSVEIDGVKSGKKWLDIDNCGAQADIWTLEAIDPREGYVGALVVGWQEYAINFYEA